MQTFPGENSTQTQLNSTRNGNQRNITVPQNSSNRHHMQVTNGDSNSRETASPRHIQYTRNQPLSETDEMSSFIHSPSAYGSTISGANSNGSNSILDHTQQRPLLTNLAAQALHSSDIGTANSSSEPPPNYEEAIAEGFDHIIIFEPMVPAYSERCDPACPPAYDDLYPA